MRSGEDGIYTYATKAKAGEEGGEVAKDVYKGAWWNNNKHGSSKQNYVGLGEYYGNWENGEKHGEGVMIYVNKDIYSGQWKNGKKDGQGTYIFTDTGMKYVGTFKAGKLE